ncbi:MAG: type II toxin-antitoxin system VapC family toxin [Phycisphaerales bacterium]|jgi:hypothetical protein|nr:type II toxin-antitoxin system VapC family toxin [Phycisphaerales bacterium]MDP6891378.1 type II toxin-antitoxin system VapC family toxin [Phycisphaerales bacterium]
MLVDTSVWIDHFRKPHAALSEALQRGSVLVHPFVVGELACGQLRCRDEVLGHLGVLPAASVASHAEVLGLVDVHGLAGTGIGWIDAHLLASAMIDHVQLITSDRSLLKQAARLGIG